MKSEAQMDVPGVDYELRFVPLTGAGPSCGFPCDAAGHVNMDALSDKVRELYLYARTVVGREYSVPAVIALSAI